MFTKLGPNGCNMIDFMTHEELGPGRLKGVSQGLVTKRKKRKRQLKEIEDIIAAR